MAGIVPRAWIDWTIDSAESFGLIGLFVVSASEAAIQPIPPDLVAWPMALGAESLLHATAIVVFATLGSVLGSLGGYWLGSFAGDMLLTRFVSKTSIQRLEVLMGRHGSFGVFFAALGPVPYKALAWTAGAASMPITPFLISGAIGRLLRFAIPVYAIWFYGETALEWFTPFRFLAISIFGLIMMIPIAQWLRNFEASEVERLRTG
ncbi:MAG: YqaA family protein [Candidatus Thalassarchaeaceae archaeon]